MLGMLNIVSKFSIYGLIKELIWSVIDQRHVGGRNHRIICPLVTGTLVKTSDI